MKKINFKAILMLVMAFILVFALVACDKDDDKPEPPEPPQPAEYTAAEYFANLWDLTSGIGSESIAEGDDVAVSADLALNLSLQWGGNVHQNVSVGLALDAVLDRTSADSHNSALKIKAYDPDNRENWFTGYFFFNDPTNIYLDLAGKNIALPFDYKNDTYAGSLHKLIFNDVVMGDATTVNDIINSLTNGMGANWSLDNLVNTLVSIMGLDLSSLLSNPQITETLAMFLPEGVELLDEEGNLNIGNLLSSQKIASIIFPSAVKKVNGNTTTYSTQLDTNMIAGVIGGIEGVMPEIKSLIQPSTQIKLEYAQTGNDFDYFTLSVGMSNIKARDVNGQQVFPVVGITINSLEFRKADAEHNTFGIDRTNYSSEVAFEEEIEVTVDGITLNPAAFNADIAPIALNNTTIAVGIKGKVDLKEKENNGTVANAWIRLGDKHVLDASFVDGDLAVKVDQTVKIGDLGVMDTIVKAFGKQAFDGIKNMFTQNGWAEAGLNDFANLFFAKNQDDTINYNAINPEFKGAVWENLDIVGGFQGMVDGIIKKITAPAPAPTPDGGQTAAELNVVDKVLKTVQMAMPLFDTANNKLVIKSNDIFAKVVEIGKIYNSNFTVDTVIDAIVNMDTSKMLEKFAKFFQIEGIEQGEKTDDVFAKDFLKAIFNKAKGELSIDLSDDGFDLAISITANANVKVDIESEFKAVDFASADYINVATEARDATTGDLNAGWIAFDMSAPQEQPAA